MKRKELGFANFATMTLVVGGLALGGLLAWGWTSGQELPLGPAIAVALVNIYAAIKIVLDTRKKQQMAPPAAAPETPAPAKQKKRSSK